MSEDGSMEEFTEEQLAFLNEIDRLREKAVELLHAVDDNSEILDLKEVRDCVEMCLFNLTEIEKHTIKQPLRAKIRSKLERNVIP